MAEQYNMFYLPRGEYPGLKIVQTPMYQEMIKDLGLEFTNFGDLYSNAKPNELADLVLKAVEENANLLGLFKGDFRSVKILESTIMDNPTTLYVIPFEKFEQLKGISLHIPLFHERDFKFSRQDAYERIGINLLESLQLDTIQKGSLQSEEKLAMGRPNAYVKLLTRFYQKITEEEIKGRQEEDLLTRI